MPDVRPLPGQAPVCLRPYQAHAIHQIDTLVAQGTRRILVVAPTGAGKTSIAGSLILRAVSQGQQVLFLAHRRELIVQAWRRLQEMGLPPEQVGILMASDARRRPAAPVQVASVDTLRRRRLPAADLVFVDECHRALSPTYLGILKEYPQAVHLGLTATPFRADGRGFREVYDDLVLVASMQQLIAEGFLVEPRVFTVPASHLPDLGRVRVRGGDYDERALADAVDQQRLVGNIVEHWQKLAAGVRTVAFAVSIAHSQHIAASFQQAGVPAEHLDGSLATEERDAILQRLERGETLVVSNCGVLAEGWDQPSVKCAILARPTKSTGLYLQQAGRILRPWQGQPALLLDHAGCAVEHGLPQDEREFSLDGDKGDPARSKRKPREPRVCPSCQLVVAPTVRVCPACTTALVATVPLPAESPEELVEARPGQFAPPPPRKTPAFRRPEYHADRATFDFLRQAARSGGQVTWEQLDAIRAGTTR
jgi:superfamily II DNA or RNA helicase